VLSRDHFGHRGQFAHNYAVDARRVARTGFVETTRLPIGFGRERTKVPQGTRTVEKYAPDASGRIGIVPPVSKGADVAVPRGSAIAPAQPADDSRRVKNAQPGTAKPEPRPPGASGGNEPVEGRTANAPPAVTPVVPPAAAPAAKPVVAPPPPPPAKGAAPAAGGVVREAPRASPQPANGAAPAGKAASAPAKRPR
jgi:hypothetical protein